MSTSIWSILSVVLYGIGIHVEGIKFVSPTYNGNIGYVLIELALWIVALVRRNQQDEDGIIPTALLVIGGLVNGFEVLSRIGIWAFHYVFTDAGFQPLTFAKLLSAPILIVLCIFLFSEYRPEEERVPTITIAGLLGMFAQFLLMMAFFSIDPETQENSTFLTDLFTELSGYKNGGITPTWSNIKNWSGVLKILLAVMLVLFLIALIKDIIRSIHNGRLFATLLSRLTCVVSLTWVMNAFFLLRNGLLYRYYIWNIAEAVIAFFFGVAIIFIPLALVGLGSRGSSSVSYSSNNSQADLDEFMMDEYDATMSKSSLSALPGTIFITVLPIDTSMGQVQRCTQIMMVMRSASGIARFPGVEPRPT